MQRSSLLTTWLACALSLVPLLAQGQSASGYCISKIDEPKAASRVPILPEHKKIDISRESKSYSIKIAGPSTLTLDEQGQAPIQSVSIRQYDSSIRAIRLGRNGALWVNADGADYLGRIAKGDPPVVSALVPLPGIVQKPCARFLSFSGCTPAESYFSSVIGHAFISGHLPTLFGWPNPRSIEIGDGVERDMPPAIQGAKLLADLPSIRVALFEGTGGEALAYDGTKVHTLLRDFLPTKRAGPGRTWYLSSPPTASRVIFTNFGLGSESSPFLVEAREDLSVSPVRRESYNPRGMLQFFELSGNQLVGLDTGSIVVFEDGALRTVARAAISRAIELPYKMNDGSVSMAVRDPATGAATYYAIAKTTAADRCKSPPATAATPQLLQ